MLQSWLCYSAPGPISLAEWPLACLCMHAGSAPNGAGLRNRAAQSCTALCKTGSLCCHADHLLYHTNAMQAVKRLMTFLQRAHPTDPSRCVDFDAYRDPGRGAAGSGSEKAVSWQACLLAAGSCAYRAAKSAGQARGLHQPACWQHVCATPGLQTWVKLLQKHFCGPANCALQPVPSIL